MKAHTPVHKNGSAAGRAGGSLPIATDLREWTDALGQAAVMKRTQTLSRGHYGVTNSLEIQNFEAREHSMRRAEEELRNVDQLTSVIDANLGSDAVSALVRSAAAGIVGRASAGGANTK